MKIGCYTAILMCGRSGQGCGDAVRDSWAIQSDASELGFDWPDISGVFAKVREELGEIDNINMHLDGLDIQDLDGNGFDPRDNIVLKPLFTWNKQILGGDPQKVWNDLYFDPWMAVHVNKDIASRTIEEVASGSEMLQQRITLTPLKSMLNMPLQIGIGCFYRIPYNECVHFFKDYCTYTTITEIKSPSYSTYSWFIPLFWSV